MNRSKRKILGQETVEIVERGWYELANHGHVDIASQVASSLDQTRLYTPADLDELVNEPQDSTWETVFEVRNETTLSAASRHIAEQGNAATLALNFASAKNPGGGFLGGSQAQEESLARSSALYASLQSRFEYYTVNRKHNSSLYTDHMILSPDVPVFRDDEGNLLSEPYLLGILTSPAVNAGAVRKNEPEKEPEIRPVMAGRIAKVLAIAIHHGYRHLILGAWGCGVFRNDPDEIAELFADALLNDSRFQGRFQSIIFAVLDRTDNEQIIEPFRQRFTQGVSP